VHDSSDEEGDGEPDDEEDEDEPAKKVSVLFT
jgi:hypothetical protein